MVVWDDLNPSQRLSVYDRGVELRQPRRRAKPATGRQVAYRLGDMVAPPCPRARRCRAWSTEFAAAIREGRAPLTDGGPGLRVLELLEAASRSLDAGGGFAWTVGR